MTSPIRPTAHRVAIEDVTPRVDDGRFPVKRIVGDEVVVEADVFADGHDHVAAALEYRRVGDAGWTAVPMTPVGIDRRMGAFTVEELGAHEFRIRGWVDQFGTWADGLAKKAAAGQDVSVDLAAGHLLVADAADRATGAASRALTRFAERLGDGTLGVDELLDVGLDGDLAGLMADWGDRSRATVTRAYPLRADRPKARFSAWYELFPRSWGEPGTHGTFADVAGKLDYVADMGFDVLYLPPIHPIGVTKRKGPNNTLDAGPEDPGVPWAIGSAEGGHTAVNPLLGTLQDFQALRERAEELGLEIAMDVAFQCSPDHPWVTEHPEWFKHRPDGSIRSAENPPKKYEDIYPIDFETSDLDGLWNALRDVFTYWIDQGVRIFRVDNPHTKAFPFWEWVIAEISADHPDVIFLAEAFTRPAVMYRLAKLGFTQSYTYFTWRNTSWELQSYMEDLGAVSEFLRPNFWPNTPDILPVYLQSGGRAAFLVRAVLAATMSSNYGVYGPEFEQMGATPRAPGSEEYLDSEKYQIREWDLGRPDSLAPVLARLNRIRRDHEALQHTDNIRFHATDNPEILAFSKAANDDLMLVVVNVDPHHIQSGYVDLPLLELGIDDQRPFQVHDLLSDRRYLWHGSRNYVELDPAGIPANVFAVRRLIRTEHDFDYYLGEVTSMSDAWFQNAIIYELHVRAFSDSNADGIGDLRGLTEKLDYLSELGVTAIWMLPFYPSPLRDDGYDIADYRSINPSYGTMRDFRRLLDAAHARDLKVITELVINHTSDQHPWFQRARKAEKGSPERDFYVWSDSPDLYRDARVIFQDTETSNWTWDPVAGAYYWHRFFSHQPDLNFANPAVRRAIFDALDFWLEMGVDGLRLDAVPYLYEQDGTMCENLPETHAFLKDLRAHVDANYEDRMLLAEANQWPEDSVAYFGDGDECHMCFHFPLMPRLFMSVKMENNFPIIDIMDQTPEIPDGTAWATFLRNHDELTLEMVTDEERDYMYRMYASDPQARINVGIRRRLAPLLGNNRRLIELLNALLFSLPGTPVLYYGDEIGMGDNIYLGDRNGVRTPMQWSGDRNAGFSKANPQRLYFPVITDPEYHFEAVNVETQQSNPNSLWWWMRRMIAQRRNLPALSLGSLRFLQPDNAKVLAFERILEDEAVLVVANLSRHVQSVELDLAHHEGLRPVEVFGRTPFPQVGELPYLLTMGPHEFYWFRFETAREEVEPDGHPRIRLRGEDADVFRARTQLGRVLATDLPRRRWFRSKASTITGVDVADVISLPGTDVRSIVADVHYAERESEQYLVPVALVDAERFEHLREHDPSKILALVTGASVDAGLVHAIDDPTFGRAVLAAMSGRGRKVGARGELRPMVKRGRRVRIDDETPVTTLGAEQSNTSIVFGDRAILKVFRKLEHGANPEVEIGRFLSDRTDFRHTPSTLGAVHYVRDGGESALGVLQEYVVNQGDAWAHTVDQVSRFMEQVLTTHARERVPGRRVHPLELVGSEPDEPLAMMLGAVPLEARLLGRRTAELHVALASDDTDPAFAPERMTTLYQRSLYQAMRTGVRQSFQLLRRRRKTLDEATAALADRVLEREQELLERLRMVTGAKVEAMRTRIHGDFHLGQVLFTGNDFSIIDFEGEPARPVSERRIKRSPLRDVAGMVRSYHYAAHAGAMAAAEQGLVGREEEAVDRVRAWTDVWFRWAAAAFLDGYLSEAAGTGVIPTDAAQVRTLLDAYLLEKVVYELGYELDNRPGWIEIALDGVLSHLD